MIGEVLYMYLAVIDHAIKAVLVKVEQKVKKPIYYVNKTTGSWGSLSSIEKSSTSRCPYH